VLYARRGFVEPWVGYLALEAGEWVGGCGFAAPPVAGEVEIAYFTFPGHEGRGVATQMATALLDLTAEAAAQGGFEFIAHTLPEENASTSILKKLGFVHEGVIDHPEDGPVSKWRRRTPRVS
jgi:[ribosomal protein S5]-alanine N-acetyltransferase